MMLIDSRFYFNPSPQYRRPTRYSIARMKSEELLLEKKEEKTLESKNTVTSDRFLADPHYFLPTET